MATAFLAIAMNEMLKKIHSLTGQKISLPWGHKEELEKLKDPLIMIRALLRDTEGREVTDEFVRLWLEKLRDVVYDAEDVLDEFDYEILRRKVEIQRKIDGVFSLSDPTAFHISMAQKVQKINECLDEFKKLATGFGPIVRAVDTSPQIRLNRETYAFLDSSAVVIGRDDDVSKLINLLISSCNQHVLSVIPVVGMGGLGKTTLAQMVCEEVHNRKHFDVTFWICVSDGFDDRRILRAMLETLNGANSGVEAVSVIMTQLQKELEKKNFLLILDDVWNEEPGKWESLKDRLLEISRNDGNAVVVTTRSRRAASIMESFPDCRHELKPLLDDECWSIIRNIASSNGGEPIPSEFEAIGIDVAKKCGGVPLAARVLGGMLHSGKEGEKWLSIEDSDAFEVLIHDRILPVLKLSFDRLSLPSLQRCFAFCSIFPKDFEIEKEQLIQLWMAEGFLGPSDGRMEEIGARYFSDLLALSLFQDVRRNEFENIRSCKMNRLVHDLAFSVSKPETMILEAGSAIHGTFLTRNLNVICCEGEESEFQELDARKLRTLFSRVDVLNKSWKFKSLRTLNLHGAAIGELPDSICRLEHLRYLDVSHADIKAFPKSITKLYHLQTLRFSGCRSITKLPEKMTNLVSLRHIDFTDTPAHVGCLIGLRTLPFFEVGPGKGNKIEELRCLKELGGELRIRNLEHVRDTEEAKGADLLGKTKINALGLEWSSERESNNCNMNDEDVLEGLRPRANIRSLKIKNYQGDAFPSWLLIPVVHNLEVLKLEGCNDCKQLPRLGRLSFLQILEVEGMNGVEVIGAEFFSSGGSDMDPIFPALKRLSLVKMKSLVEWKIPRGGAVGKGDAAVVLPCLEELYIKECPQLKSIPSMAHLSSKLVKLDISHCDELSHLSGEFHASTPSIKYLSISNCENLASVPSLQHCTALEELYINRCHKLVSINLGGDFRESLKRVSIQFCGRITSLPIRRLLSCPSLEELIIKWCGEFIFFEDDDDVLRGEALLPSSHLRSLEILWCNKLTSVPDGLYRRRLHSLVRLSIFWCLGLSYLADDFFCGLTQLKELRIGRLSEELEAFPGMNSIRQLSGSLEKLTITGWKKLKSIPHQLQHLTSLKKLNLVGFEVEEFEEALPDWMGNLSSLQQLSIHSCSHVKYLPSSTAMQRLSKLTSLEIGRRTLLLGQNCAEGSGSEWHKISHISNIITELPWLH